MVDRARYAFRLSAWNELAGVDDHYTLFFYMRADGVPELEVYESKHKGRRYLSRIEYRALNLEDCRPGARVVIFGRQYKVEAYEDDFTREKLGRAQASCFALLGPEGIPHAIGGVWSALEASGLRVVAARQVVLSREDAEAIGSRLDAPLVGPAGGGGAARGGGVDASGSSVPVLALQVMGEGVAEKVGGVQGHVSAEAGGPLLLLADTPEHSSSLSEAFFGPPSRRLPSAREPTAVMRSCSCLLVLPHVVTSGTAGACLQETLTAVSRVGLSVTALRSADLTRTQAEEFLEVYKGVVPEYADLLNEYSSGPLLALEVTGEDAVGKVRELAGPRDVDVAKRIRPESLRARFAAGKGRLGVHVTELSEDGPLESEFLFALLDRVEG